MKTGKFEEKLAALAHEAGKMTAEHRMLELAASQVVAHYTAIRGDGDWCEPALKNALDYLEVVCYAVDESENRKS